jgi:hypothetical protein
MESFVPAPPYFLSARRRTSPAIFKVLGTDSGELIPIDHFLRAPFSLNPLPFISVIPIMRLLVFFARRFYTTIVHGRLPAGKAHKFHR